MKSIIGEYSKMAETLISDKPGSLSFRNQKYSDLSSWEKAAVNTVPEMISPPMLEGSESPEVVCRDRYEWDGLIVEELAWQLPFGRETEALFLKPSTAEGKLPGILALHDHAGKKFWGYKKIARGENSPHPLMAEHHKEYYDGLCWANEIAKQGFAVLVHDTFPFASRKVNVRDVLKDVQREMSLKEPVSDDDIEAYNHWAAGHEHDMAKSLFCAGTTWPGVTLMEDRIALDILASREDIDSSRLGCGGLSGGGMRTVFLGGLDNARALMDAMERYSFYYS